MKTFFKNFIKERISMPVWVAFCIFGWFSILIFFPDFINYHRDFPWPTFVMIAIFWFLARFIENKEK